MMENTVGKLASGLRPMNMSATDTPPVFSFTVTDYDAGGISGHHHSATAPQVSTHKVKQ